MNWRVLIILLGAVAALPLAARAQQPRDAGGRVLLSARSPAEAAICPAARFAKAWVEAGYFEGKNVTIAYRWAEGRDAIACRSWPPSWSADQVAVIAATGGEPSPLVVWKAATTTITDRLHSRRRPGRGGACRQSQPARRTISTGTTIMAVEMAPKRLELNSRQLVPKTDRHRDAYQPKVFRPPRPRPRARAGCACAPAGHADAMSWTPAPKVKSTRPSRTIAEQRGGALIVGTDPFLLGQRDQLVRLAARRMVPTVYFLREFVDAGGLMSYGPNIHNGYRQAGVYTGLVLSGASGSLAGDPTHQVRAGDQPQDRQGVRSRQCRPMLLALADEVSE